MRKSFFIAALMLVFCLGAFAQSKDQSKVDVFGGYQFTSVDDSLNGAGHVALNGWNASLTGYFKPNLGLTADFSGAYGKPNEAGFDVTKREHYFLFGPTYRTGSDKATLFAHALFGATRSSDQIMGIPATDNAFAMALGGGLDLKASKNVSFRAGQFDYLYTHLAGEKQNNFRYSAGIVFHF